MVTIYTNETCPYCKSIKDELDKNKIEYVEKLTKDYATIWKQIVTLTGMPTVPTISIGEDYLVPGRDFNNAQHAIQIITHHESELPFSYNRQALERIKTLNYNINQAFVNLDKLLKQIENNTK
jgi:glutaredoxin